MLRPWRRRRGQPVLRPLPDSGLWTLAVAVVVAAAVAAAAAVAVAAAAAAVAVAATAAVAVAATAAVAVAATVVVIDAAQPFAAAAVAATAQPVTVAVLAGSTASASDVPKHSNLGWRTVRDAWADGRRRVSQKRLLLRLQGPDPAHTAGLRGQVRRRCREVRCILVEAFRHRLRPLRRRGPARPGRGGW